MFTSFVILIVWHYLLCLSLQKLHQELIARALEIEQRNCLAGSSAAFSHQVHASTLPASSSMHGRTTPPASTMAHSWTPGGSLPRSRTPTNGMSQSQTLPPARSRTPPVCSSNSRSQTPPVTVSRSRTPPISGSSARSRTPPAGGLNRSRTPPATSITRSRTPPGDTQQTRVRVPSGSPRRRVLPSVPGSDDQTPTNGRRGSTAYRDRYRLLLELSSARKKQLEDNLERVREVSFYYYSFKLILTLSENCKEVNWRKWQCMTATC